jgi:predicted ester cyclase
MSPELPDSLTHSHPQAFPDVCFRLLSPYPLIAEEEYVVARWFGGGKHTGPAFFDLPIGALPEPNSGREMRFSGTTIYTLKDGKIVEETGEEAGLLALQQLGVLPAN